MPSDLPLGSSNTQPTGGLTTRAYRVVPDVPYRVCDAREIRLDLYLPLPSSSRPWPVVLFIHGGSWRSHSRSDFDPTWLPPEADLAFATIDYRHAPAYRFPAQLEDCHAAVQWLSEHAAPYDLDPQRLAVMGSSAGGHLALLLATGAMRDIAPQSPATQPSPPIRAAVAFYAPTDFPAVGESVDGRPGRTPDPPGRGPIQTLLGTTPAGNPQLARLASPIYHVTPRCPPVMLLHGSNDRFVPLQQSKSMAAALRAAEVQCELVIVPGADHGFEKPPHLPGVYAFLRRHLAAASQ